VSEASAAVQQVRTAGTDFGGGAWSASRPPAPATRVLAPAPEGPGRSPARQGRESLGSALPLLAHRGAVLSRTVASGPVGGGLCCGVVGVPAPQLFVAFGRLALLHGVELLPHSVD
jgi:hypothetical protein